MNEDQEISRGRNAKSLLENELLNEALNTLEQHFEDSWRNTTKSQRAVREEAYNMLCMLAVFRAHLTKLIETGKMASITKAQREEMELRERELGDWDGSPGGHSPT